jgi:hypothetical protein
MFSESDDVVPLGHADKFRERLEEAEIRVLGGLEGHFRMEEFSELIDRINEDIA